MLCPFTEQARFGLWALYVRVTLPTYGWLQGDIDVGVSVQ